jgi:hypothetical protein
VKVNIVKRQILIVSGVAPLAACGFGLVMGTGWLVFHLVVRVFPYALQSRLSAMQGALWTLFGLVTVVAAGMAASVLFSDRNREHQGEDRDKGQNRERDLSFHPRLRG